MKTLPPQHLTFEDYKQLFARIDAILWEVVYRPLVDLVRPSLPSPVAASIAPRKMKGETALELRNAGADALRRALRDGVVQVVPDPKTKRTRFVVAKPDRQISDGLREIGATLDKRTGDWTCAPSQVPSWVRAAAQDYSQRARDAHDEAKKLLDRLEKNIDKSVENAEMLEASDHAVTRVAGGWLGRAKAMEASWDLGPVGQNELAAEFAKSRGIQIKSPGSKVSMVSAFEEGAKAEVKVWAKEALTRLRDQVDENAIQGYRAEGLAKRIRNEYGVSKGRADLIARQETSNFMANFRQARAKDSGLKRYVWYAALDARTRPEHRRLHGTVQEYDRPPIVDAKTGRRGNPGQDFRCRCVDKPIVE